MNDLKIPSTTTMLIFKLDQSYDSYHTMEIPDSVQVIDANNMMFIKKLPKLPKNLKVLHASGAGLEELPELPEGIESVNVSFNKLKKLPDLPKSIRHLNFNNNYLNKMPELPESLITLDCGNSNIKNLEKIPSHLIKLNCQNTKLESLPKLPDSLEELDIDGIKKIKEFPPLPKSLKRLNYSYSGIQKLSDILPPKIEYIIGNDKIRVIPKLPESIKYFYLQAESYGEKNSLVPPFKDMYENYKNGRYNDIDTFRKMVNKYHDLKREGRNTLGLETTLARPGALSQILKRNKNGNKNGNKSNTVTRKRCNGNNKNCSKKNSRTKKLPPVQNLPPDILDAIGSFLSEEKGSLNTKRATLKKKVAKIIK